MCPGEPKKPDEPRPIVESAPLSAFTPETPRNPTEKAPKQTQDFVLKFH